MCVENGNMDDVLPTGTFISMEVVGCHRPTRTLKPILNVQMNLAS